MLFKKELSATVRFDKTFLIERAKAPGLKSPTTNNKKIKKGDLNMSDFIKETFEFKVETEEEAVDLINDFKDKSTGIVSYKTVYRTKKEKGEVVDSWYIVTLTQNFKV